jgi:hypothetical protein
MNATRPDNRFRVKRDRASLTAPLRPERPARPRRSHRRRSLGHAPRKSREPAARWARHSADRSGLGALPGRIVRGHGIAQALRTHVGPVLLHVLDTGGTAVLAEHDSPSGWNLCEGGPQECCSSSLTRTKKRPSSSSKGLVLNFTSLDTGAMYGIAPGSHGAGLLPTPGAERPERCFDTSKQDVTPGRLPTLSPRRRAISPRRSPAESC